MRPRRSTKRIASGFDVTGWVKNLPDGSVEAEAEGSEDQLQAFGKILHTGPALSRVDEVQVRDVEARDALPVRFEVRR